MSSSSSSLHILPFTLNNPVAFSLDPDGPFPVLFRGIDLSAFTGKTVLITGATGGCGMECAKVFARVGARLVVTARSKEKGDIAAREIIHDAVKAGGDGGEVVDVDVLELDLGSWESLRRFKEELEGRYEHLYLVILNARVNVLSTLLTSLITIPPLKASPSSPSRLILISSEAHAWSHPRQSTFPLLLKTLNDEALYMPYKRYQVSKLLLVLCAQELAQRLGSEKVLVASASSGVHAEWPVPRVQFEVVGEGH
ncbi:hypothetical protein BJY01DRAFT_248050 [Aspergillus pseudoustus]|uniref:NAD(P)-binding protein n=1 Tax=Aspergillus pseudoustus TaxID=1810923 RepID=A0ABR4JXK8_9EURO